MIVGKIYPNYVEFKSISDFNLSRDEDFRGSNYLAVLKSEKELIAGLSN
jgi:hypothetical protein